MDKIRAIILSLFLVFILISPLSVFGQNSFATCDLCGYCNGREVPQAWESCRKCLYPSAAPSVTTGDTLRIGPDDTNTNVPATPFPGHYYTTIGCLSTNLKDFTDPGAAGSVVQQLLTMVFSFAGGLAFLYLLFGAFLVLTSQSDPEKLNRGKRTIYGAVIGIIFTVSAVFIVNLIGSTILKIPGFGQ